MTLELVGLDLDHHLDPHGAVGDLVLFGADESYAQRAVTGTESAPGLRIRQDGFDAAATDLVAGGRVVEVGVAPSDAMTVMDPLPPTSSLRAEILTPFHDMGPVMLPSWFFQPP